MISCLANCSNKKAQLKIQQMAFVLVAFMVLLGVAGVFYVSIKSSSLEESVSDLKHERASEIARKLASSPELSWIENDCSVCLDVDKALVLKDKESYDEFWSKDIGLIRIQRVYPLSENRECDANYETCDRITIYELDNAEYVTEEAFVALCRYTGTEEGKKCELGKIMLGVKENE